MRATDFSLVYRIGCYTCRLRRKKCDESHPACLACFSLGVTCEYDLPAWWNSTAQRKNHKEIIKEKIKQTKVDEKNNAAASKSIEIRCYSLV
jgi:hypothetical protein